VDDKTEARRELADTRVTNAWESFREYKERDLIVTSRLDQQTRSKFHKPGKSPCDKLVEV
jgi:hypothetical protein